MQRLREKMESYFPLSEETWALFLQICRVRELRKGQMLLRAGEVPRSFYFVFRGLFRSFVLSGDGAKEINNTFFEEGRFPASVVALLEASESKHFLQALEDSVVVEIDHRKYRALLAESEDLKMYHIHYLERHWVMEKEPQQISLLSEDAGERYREFLKRYPHIVDRIPLHHIASRIGITATQLSRIRKRMR